MIFQEKTEDKTSDSIKKRHKYKREVFKFFRQMIFKVSETPIQQLIFSAVLPENFFR